MPKHRDFAELKDLLAEVQKIPLSEVVDIPYDLEEGQHAFATVKHADLKRLYTAQVERIQRVKKLRVQLPEKLAGDPKIAETLIDQIENAAQEVELLKHLFFYLLLKRYAPPSYETIGVARGWQIYWEGPRANEELFSLITFSNLDNPDGTEDPD
ncbi:hypothetical protein KKF05_04895 [Patescibacteria group bacterium]|nr:hypothetical protein [Patescibacteria group bacterium]MBU1028897.1 hypothetical protein [Patescibacteria group bacterium]MBU1915993.1 hypothetical protein [Patescibacteria group bacterium]